MDFTGIISIKIFCFLNINDNLFRLSFLNFISNKFEKK